MTGKLNKLGQLLRGTREQVGLSRDELARRIGLDASYIYRLETGDRRPSREVTLALAEALGIKTDALDQWLMTAGFAPQPLLTLVRGKARTRGGRRGSEDESSASAHWGTARWAEWLEELGLREATIRRLLKAMETAKMTVRQEVSRTIFTAITRSAESLESPIRAAVIPAAGGQSRLLATHLMQRLLLRVIGEALEAGISNIILVLAPGMAETLFSPLKDALSLAIAPAVRLQYCEQANPEGLGAAILQAETLVGGEAFAVLLPDDVLGASAARATQPREFRRLIEAFRQFKDAHLIAVTSAPKSKLLRGGVAKLGAKPVSPQIFPVHRLAEKPESGHPLYHDQRVYGVVGRYLMSPSIFLPLRELYQKVRRPAHLTDALEIARRRGEAVYAFELTAARQDVGEILDQASDLFGIFLDQPSRSEGV